jgi:hypothetical protein
LSLGTTALYRLGRGFSKLGSSSWRDSNYGFDVGGIFMIFLVLCELVKIIL